MKQLITIALLFIAALGFAQTKIENVDAVTFKKLIDEKKAYLIDLRTDDELKTKGYIKGAAHIDFLKKDAESVISNLDKKKTYLIYCAGGGRSGDCAELMQKQGFEHVINLEKGFDDWKKKGFEVEKKE
ncbi:MAG: Rhodanese-like protein [Bacteroidota bacterium]|jgi:rhodanese-related sulfurtransferase|nr:Rhodanese-like protein [Bacteroidota bacterium]